jgi:glycosyltransferase involved in cell wall biosynthesis
MTRPYLEGGGATLSILNLAGGLVKKGHRVSIATKGGRWLSRAEDANLAIFQLPLSPSTPLHLMASVQRLRHIIQQEQVDLIHSHHRFAALASNLARKGLKIPHVTTVHEYTINFEQLTRFGMGERIITFSKTLKGHLVNHYHLPVERVEVVRMGIGQIDKSSYKKQGPDRPSIGCIARLSPEKGVGNLLLAMAQIVQSTSQAPHCYIIGDGPLLDNLRSQAERLNIRNVVTFLGWKDNIGEWISKFDFLVLPSLQEGFGLVVLEGWAQERPTIGSLVGGISEIIDDGKNGVLIQPGDIKALAGAILRLLENPDLAHNLGKRGRLEVLPRYTIEAMVRETERIYFGINER